MKALLTMAMLSALVMYGVAYGIVVDTAQKTVPCCKKNACFYVTEISCKTMGGTVVKSCEECRE